LNLPSDDPLQRCPDISKAQESLGWNPKVKLRDGLSKTIDYFDGLLAARSPAAMEAAE
ncbi:MAG: SDR family NAD-dependent epimerase/dehydratase, partial [Pseudomonadota bacterium]